MIFFSSIKATVAQPRQAPRPSGAFQINIFGDLAGANGSLGGDVRVGLMRRL